ncbi:hypothetical protein BDW74DRAFT_175194 [Aspergillus multicolor]|uniref:uncharacterized protein n=1 Tax=Aspergillus multicolor TaxID=41759 RepID=UPI003CCDD190
MAMCLNMIVFSRFASTLAVALRLITRAKVQHAPFWVDDWFVLASLVPTYGSLACITAAKGAQYGIGKHVWAAATEDYVRINQIGFSHLLVYFFTLLLIKLSILLFYRRLFAFWIPLTLQLCILLTLAQYTACTITFLCGCQPPAYYWRKITAPQSGSCNFDTDLFQLLSSSLNVFADLLILAVPVPLVWRLQTRPLQKGLVVGVFLLGSFACIASAIRIRYLVLFMQDSDWTWVLGDVFVWTTVEPCVGIVCACLPTLNPLARRALQRIGLVSSGSSRTPTRSLRGNRDGLYGQGRRSNLHWKGTGSAGAGGASERRVRGDEALLETTVAEVEMDDLGGGGRCESETRAEQFGDYTGTDTRTVGGVGRCVQLEDPGWEGEFKW